MHRFLASLSRLFDQAPRRLAAVRHRGVRSACTKPLFNLGDAAAWGMVVALACGASTAQAAWDPNKIRQEAQRRGAPTAAAAQRWMVAMAAQRGKAEIDQVRSINAYFNQSIEFHDDIEAWGVVDHWATPLEMLEKGMGDCEDYALAKYFSLLALGVLPQRMRLVYVRAQMSPANGGGIQAHMVLAYYPSAEGDPLILDNLVESVQSARRRSDLAPVFSFNSEGLWVGTQGERVGEAVARLSKWADVLARARAEGAF
jgi:predicted transglutaminase-like cysteine proteinase